MGNAVLPSLVGEWLEVGSSAPRRGVNRSPDDRENAARMGENAAGITRAENCDASDRHMRYRCLRPPSGWEASPISCDGSQEK
jgi:hypothetical protein